MAPRTAYTYNAQSVPAAASGVGGYQAQNYGLGGRALILLAFHDLQLGSGLSVADLAKLVRLDCS